MSSPQISSPQSPMRPPSLIMGTNSTLGSEGKQSLLSSPEEETEFVGEELIFEFQACGFWAIFICAPVRSFVFCIRHGKVIVPPTKIHIYKHFTVNLFVGKCLPDCCEELKIKAVMPWPVWNNQSLFGASCDRRRSCKSRIWEQQKNKKPYFGHYEVQQYCFDFSLSLHWWVFHFFECVWKTTNTEFKAHSFPDVCVLIMCIWSFDIWYAFSFVLVFNIQHKHSWPMC